MTTIAGTHVNKWDLQRVFETDPLLSTADRYTALHILQAWDDQCRPVDSKLPAQALIGRRIHARRETVCRSLRRLVRAGYFRSTWKSVPRKTKQGIKGVTRVLVTPGPLLEKLLGHRRSAGQARGVTSHHTPRTPRGDPVAVSSPAIANSADRRRPSGADTREDRRNAAASWPRLAGTRPINPENLPSAIPVRAYNDPEAYRRRIAELDAALEAKMARRQPRRLPRRSR